MRLFDLRTTSARETHALRRLEAAPALGSHVIDDAALDALVADALPAMPLKVQVQTQTRCNAACVMCPYDDVTHAPGFTHGQMTEAMYRRLLESLRGERVERFSPFLMNEPLLDKRMPQWLAWAREALPHTSLGLFTNGSALTVERARALVDAGLNELCVSVHGFEARDYERVMVGLSFERVMSTLREVVVEYSGGGLGQLDLQIVTGDEPALNATPPPAWLAPYVLCKGFSNERAVNMLDVSGEAALRPLDLDPTDPDAGRPLCQRPFVKLYVLASGECVMCNCDWRRRVVLGHLGEQSLREIWHGERYRALRRLHARRQFDADHPCAGCNYPSVVDA